MLSVFVEYSIDAAHFLPNVPKGHKCGNMHGHRYDIRIEVTGELNPGTGWIVDYADIKQVVDPIMARLDHKVLNEIKDLENPTCEHITMWLHSQIEPQFLRISSIEVRETDRAGCVWRSD